MSNYHAHTVTAVRSESSGTLQIRAARARDASAVHRLVIESGTLEVNSPYAYAFLFNEFAMTCRVAERGGELVGFTLALSPPTRPDTVFVWQICVSDSARKLGLAADMLRSVAFESTPPFRYLEATVAPSNLASRALFHGFAKRFGAPLFETTYLEPHHFPGSAHEPEPLLRIGPLQRDRP